MTKKIIKGVGILSLFIFVLSSIYYFERSKHKHFNEIDPHQKIIDRCEAVVMKAHRMEREYIELHFQIQAEKINDLIEQNKKMALELSRLKEENFSVNNGRDNSASGRR